MFLLEGETWEKILLALIGGIGGFLGGLFSKLLTLIFPPYAHLVEEVKSLRAEIKEERKENERLRTVIEGLQDALEDHEDSTKEHRIPT